MNLTKSLAIITAFVVPGIGQCQESGSLTNQQEQKVSSGFTLHNEEVKQITVTTAAMVCARSEPLRDDVRDREQFVVPPGITVVTAAMVCGNSQVQSGLTHAWQDRQVGNMATINNNYYQQSMRALEPAAVIYEEPSQLYYYGSPLAVLEFGAGIQLGGGYYPPYWEYGNSYNEFNHIRNTEYLYGINRNHSYYNVGNYGNYGYGTRNFPPVRFLPPVNRAGPIPAPPRGYYGGGHHRQTFR